MPKSLLWPQQQIAIGPIVQQVTFGNIERVREKGHKNPSVYFILVIIAAWALDSSPTAGVLQRETAIPSYRASAA